MYLCIRIHILSDQEVRGRPDCIVHIYGNSGYVGIYNNTSQISQAQEEPRIFKKGTTVASGHFPLGTQS